MVFQNTYLIFKIFQVPSKSVEQGFPFLKVFFYNIVDLYEFTK